MFHYVPLLKGLMCKIKSLQSSFETVKAASQIAIDHLLANAKMTTIVRGTMCNALPHLMQGNLTQWAFKCN